MFTGMEGLVILAGIGAIAWVNWYFFIAGRTPARGAGKGASGAQDEAIAVDGGSASGTATVKIGRAEE